ncbi:MAG TPA: TonB-dependent receptor [Pyrinomonadaceae bacterium]|nr:TonB-dependent receptor [Pyrinomonadaceae bacterium]
MFVGIKTRILISTAMLVMLAATAFAQVGGKISGTVRDQNDAVVPGAAVTLFDVATGRRTNVTTDSGGRFEFSGLRPGDYRVIASGKGFGEVAQDVVITATGASVTSDFTLAPGAIRDVVTVTAGKGTERLAVETPQTVTVATSDQIEQRLPRSTFETIERAPNLTSIETNPARERPRLRGLSSTRLLVVIDGEKLNNARSDPGASGAPMGIIDPSQLESVEVVAGSGSSLYGSDSIAGTINLVTKAPVRPDQGTIIGMRLDGNYLTNGAIRRGNLTLNIANKFAAFRASGNLYRLENYKMGGGEVTLAQNVTYGNFFRQFPTNAAGTTFQSAASYPIFALPKNAEILNGQGSGGGKQFDVWFFPSEKHNFRGRYLNRGEGNNGNAFSGPPYEVQERYSQYRSFDKFGVRYEGYQLAKFIPRVSVNFFHQKISFPQNQYTFTNISGAAGSYLNSTTFTGNPSIFGSGALPTGTLSGASFTDNRNTITTQGLDVQAALLPFRGMLVTVGAGRTKDDSRDYFYTSPFAGFGTQRVLTGTATIGASSPLSDYTDNNFYVQGEFDRIRWVRLTAGIRFDNWVTNAQPGGGFPLSTEFAALNAAVPGLTANPGALGSLVASLPQLTQLAGGTGSVGSNRTSRTYNFGIVGRLPWGINPYFRWASSYREPGITERYLIRNFSPGSFFASLVVGNPNLSPETGKNYDVGVKVQQKYFNFSLGYFRNELTNFLNYAPAQNYCVTPVPGLPGSPAATAFGCVAGQAVVGVNARINFGSGLIRGWESTGEGSIPLGKLGSLNPFYTLGALYGRNDNPTTTQIAQINAVYNRSDTLIPLSGSATDFPFPGITPFRFIGGVQYLDRTGRFYAEYSWRHQNRVKRADPGQFVGTTLINYGSFASMNSFDKQAIKAGYSWRNDKYKWSVNAGIDNLTDELFWEHFNTAPAPGRSFVFGFTIEVFNFLKK